MVLLPDSGELAARYAPYILELQEFFAVHDLRCGSPRELGFLGARLSGRDTFAAEFASMVRSFIFREGGSIPLPVLLTVVAVAIGGPAVNDSAPTLQHPLTDLAAFLASVARAPLDQPRSVAADADAEPFADPARSSKPSATVNSFAEPSPSPSPFLPPLSSKAALAPATLAASKLTPSQPVVVRSVPGDPAGRRGVWVLLAVGLPLLLLAALLFHEFNPPPQAPVASSLNPAPQPNAPGALLSAPPSSSISAPLVTPQTPLASAVAALSHPDSSGSVHRAAPSSAGGTKLSAPNAPSTQAAASVAVSSPPPAGASSSLPRSESSTPSPAPAATTAAAPKRPESPAVPSHASSSSTSGVASVATVTAQQGAFGVSSGIMSSHLISFSPPKYPTMAGFTHAQGQVILQAVVSKTGKVSAVKAITGPRTLRKAAETAVRQWRYRPYVADGRAADVATIITIDVKPPH